MLLTARASCFLRFSGTLSWFWSLVPIFKHTTLTLQNWNETLNQSEQMQINSSLILHFRAPQPNLDFYSYELIPLKNLESTSPSAQIDDTWYLWTTTQMGFWLRTVKQGTGTKNQHGLLYWNRYSLKMTNFCEKLGDLEKKEKQLMPWSKFKTQNLVPKDY